MSPCMRWAAGARPTHPRPWLLRHTYSLLTCSRRAIHVDGRARLSNEWVPTGGIAVSKDEGMLLMCCARKPKSKRVTKKHRCASKVDSSRFRSSGTVVRRMWFGPRLAHVLPVSCGHLPTLALWLEGPGQDHSDSRPAYAKFRCAKSILYNSQPFKCLFRLDRRIQSSTIGHLVGSSMGTEWAS